LNQKQETRSSSGFLAPQSKLRQATHWLFDFIFPPTCHGCGRVDTRWCHVCSEELAQIPIQIKNFTPETLTELCATAHHTGKLQEAIQALKYHNVPDLAKPLGQRLSQVISDKNWIIDTIIPVPLFADREHKRGYNQAYLLTQQVGKMTNITCQSNLLKRHRDTNQQVGLNASERRENVKDAFTATQSVADMSILIIDDVVTTGSTLDACATALFNVGAKSVYAITVTHA